MPIKKSSCGLLSGPSRQLIIESRTVVVWRNWREQTRPHSCGLRRIHDRKCSFGELTESRGTNEGMRRVYAHYRYYAGRFSHVFVRVLSAENCGGGRDSISNDSRPRILHAAFCQRDVRRRRLNTRFDARSRRAHSTDDKTPRDSPSYLRL